MGTPLSLSHFRSEYGRASAFTVLGNGLSFSVENRAHVPTCRNDRLQGEVALHYRETPETEFEGMRSNDVRLGLDKLCVG